MIRKIAKAIRLLTEGLLSLFALPIIYSPGLAGEKLRYLYYKPKLKYLGKNVKIDIGVQFINPNFISIDDNTWVDKNVILLAGKPIIGEREIKVKDNPNYNGGVGEIYIGANCHIAPNCIISGIGGVWIDNNVGIASDCKIYSFTHHYRSFKNPQNKEIYFALMVPQRNQCLLMGPIVLQNNTGLASNCFVLPGVTVFEDSWVGLNSVINKDIPRNSTAFGHPARVIKQRYPDQENEKGK